MTARSFTQSRGVSRRAAEFSRRAAEFSRRAAEFSRRAAEFSRRAAESHAEPRSSHAEPRSLTQSRGVLTQSRGVSRRAAESHAEPRSATRSREVSQSVEARSKSRIGARRGHRIGARNPERLQQSHSSPAHSLATVGAPPVPLGGPLRLNAFPVPHTGAGKSSNLAKPRDYGVSRRAAECHTEPRSLAERGCPKQEPNRRVPRHALAREIQNVHNKAIQPQHTHVAAGHVRLDDDLPLHILARDHVLSVRRRRASRPTRRTSAIERFSRPAPGRRQELQSREALRLNAFPVPHPGAGKSSNLAKPCD